jgi:hypothetical protein
MVNDLLVDLQKEGFHIYAVVDDIATIVSGHFIKTLRDLTENALKITKRWCKIKV